MTGTNLIPLNWYVMMEMNWFKDCKLFVKFGNAEKKKNPHLIGLVFMRYDMTINVVFLFEELGMPRLEFLRVRCVMPHKVTLSREEEEARHQSKKSCK